MENDKIIINETDTLSLYQKDCIFNKQCTLAFIETESPNGAKHIKTQCTKCGYQTGGEISKRDLKASDVVLSFNQELYDTVYKKKLKEIFAMSGENVEMDKMLRHIKKAIRKGNYR